MQGRAIEGTCDPAFVGVREAFAANFAHNDEIGAAIAVVRDGRIVVDLWGGVRTPSTGALWTSGTRANIWSTTKGVAALCFAMLVDRGKLSYEDRVAAHWPEFAAHKKEHVTVGQLLSHQAGLCGFSTPATLHDFYDQPAAEARLAAQAPLWNPGAQCGYHALTMGPLANALFQRVEGRSLRRFVAEELAQPFDLDISIGLEREAPDDVADLIAPPAMSSSGDTPELTVVQQFALANPAFDPTVANGREWRAASLPSANGFANARSLARLYGALAQGGRLDERQLVGAEALVQATAVQIECDDAVLGIRARWAAGFLRNVLGIYGASEAAFGHSGWGGSFAYADPATRTGVAYVMNRMGTLLIGDPRATGLIAALPSA